MAPFAVFSFVCNADEALLCLCFLHDILFGKFLGNFVFVTVANMLSLTTHAYDSLSGGSLAGGHRSLVGIVVVETDVGLISYFHHSRTSVSLC